MAKGYWIVNNEVQDPVAYEEYKAANAAPLAEYGGRFLVRGGRQELREGAGYPRTVVIEFPSYRAAVDCYESEPYQKAVALREPAARGTLIIVEGYES